MFSRLLITSDTVISCIAPQKTTKKGSLSIEVRLLLKESEIGSTLTLEETEKSQDSDDGDDDDDDDDTSSEEVTQQSGNSDEISTTSLHDTKLYPYSMANSILSLTEHSIYSDSLKILLY